MGTSVTVGGGKWTLRNGIFNHKIFNDILMIQFDFCFMKYKKKIPEPTNKFQFFFTMGYLLCFCDDFI
jgi:hypothetical protein